MACQHLTAYYVEPHFLSPQITKTTWVCLHDGCYKLKKNLTRQQLISHGQRLQYVHRVMINCQTLEIFCTICKKQLFDLPYDEQGRTKNSKIPIINPYHIRQYLTIPSSSQNVIYAGQIEYPPSFQKQKKGLCGLKMNGINTYLNSIVHLLAYIPTITSIFQKIQLKMIDNQFIRSLVQAINTIWSGKYRILNIDKLDKILIHSDPTFMSYTSKTPNQVLYYIIRSFLQQFHFDQLPCNKNQIIQDLHDQWNNNGRYYNLIKQTFGGQCVLQKICSHCHNVISNVNKFQSLKVSYEKSFDVNYKGMLFALIEQAFNWRNSHQIDAENIQKGKQLCPKCQKTIKQFNSYINLPNNLILQFGQDINGLNMQLPDQLNLLKFSKPQKQSQQQAIYDYLGCINRKDKHYFTHVKSHKNQKQYLFCDQNIQQSEKPKNNIKLAIYKRRINPKYLPLQKNILSCLEVGLRPVVPLPDFWSIYLKQHHNVPPLMNPFICSHGKLKSNIKLTKLTIPERVPVEIYQYLLQTFGGRKIYIENQDDYCPKCQQLQSFVNQIKTSEKQMAAFADKFSHKKDWVYINRIWLEKWKKFAYSDHHKGYRILGHPRPGPINNQITNQEQVNSTHKKISAEVWYFLHKFYSGGPKVPSKKYSPNVVVTASVNLRFESLRQKLAILNGKESAKSTEYSGNKIEQLQEQNAQQN